MFLPLLRETCTSVKKHIHHLMIWYNEFKATANFCSEIMAFPRLSLHMIDFTTLSFGISNLYAAYEMIAEMRCAHEQKHSVSELNCFNSYN